MKYQNTTHLVERLSVNQLTWKQVSHLTSRLTVKSGFHTEGHVSF